MHNPSDRFWVVTALQIAVLVHSVGSPAFAFKKPGWVKKVQSAAPTVPKPPVVKALQEGAEKLKDNLEDSPSKAVKSIRVELKRTVEFGASRGETFGGAVNSEVLRALKVQNWERWIVDPEQVAIDALHRGGNSVKVEANAAVAYVKDQWYYKKLQRHLLSLLLEEPTYIVCGAERPGPPVWYVNGICTTKYHATKAGNAIAERLDRRVHVLYNPTVIEPPYQTGLKAKGFGNNDIDECVYDRAWPATVLSRLDILTESLLGGLVKNKEKLQANPTTRQLAHVLYYSDEPVSLVTHSQGVLIARNAFFTNWILGKESKIRNNTAWVAAGLPLSDHEIFPRPKRTTILSYSDDPVSKLLGLRGGGVELKPADHDFMENYKDQLHENQIWPANCKPAVAVGFASLKDTMHLATRVKQEHFSDHVHWAENSRPETVTSESKRLAKEILNRLDSLSGELLIEVHVRSKDAANRIANGGNGHKWEATRAWVKAHSNIATDAFLKKEARVFLLQIDNK
jgi:hypothetical protein